MKIKIKRSGAYRMGPSKKIGMGCLVTSLLCLNFACKKLVDVQAPPTGLVATNVYTNDATAIAVLTGIYADMSNGLVMVNGSNGLSFLCGLSADELTLWSGASNGQQSAYYSNALSANTYGSDYWLTAYPYIFKCNDAIAGLNSSTMLTPAIKNELLGEALFMRAYFYFYLTNLFGDVPLALTTNYKVNESLARVPQTQVYQQIVADLKSAQNLLSVNYTDGTLVTVSADRLRPTKWAADALLARVYLYTGDYTDAATQSSQLINNTSVFSLSPLANVFLIASSGNNEAIWQLQPVAPVGPSSLYDALYFEIPATGPNTSQTVYLSDNLLKSFEPNDGRKTNWVDSVTVSDTTYFYPDKYKLVTDGGTISQYQTLFRLGEQYLIRAEAEANLGDMTQATADLNAIRNRAGLPPSTILTPASTPAQAMNAILHERQIELFTELGQRWLDLKRTHTVDAVMQLVTPQKGGAWNTNQKLYPVLLSDIRLDPKLTQNTGY